MRVERFHRRRLRGVHESASRDRIDLRPRITVRGDADHQRLLHLCEVAHSECFIANSLTTEVVVHPTFTFVD